MKIFLVRHAEVDEKYRNCYNGHIDISLSQKGIADARALGEKLKEIPFDAIFCSDLKRARETLAEFAHANYPSFSAQLREKSWGRYEGMSFEEIVSQGEIKYENFQQWLDALGGESYEAFSARVKSFFFDYLFTQDFQNVLVVTHAGVIRTLLTLERNLGLQEAFGIELPYASCILYDTNKPLADLIFIKVNR